MQNRSRSESDSAQHSTENKTSKLQPVTPITNTTSSTIKQLAHPLQFTKIINRGHQQHTSYIYGDPYQSLKFSVEDLLFYQNSGKPFSVIRKSHTYTKPHNAIITKSHPTRVAFSFYP
jgi:hypothetical protein